MATITLGKDCSVSIGGNLVGVRSATLTYKAVTVEATYPFQNYVDSINCGFDATCTVELNDSDAISGLFSAITDGSTLSVSGGSAGISFEGVIVGLSNSFSVDGVETFSVQAKQGISRS